MKSGQKFLTGFAIVAIILSVVATGCKKDKVTPPRTITYQLGVKDVVGVSGSVTFTETSSTQTTIDLVLTNGPSGAHPAHIHAGAAVETGNIVITLNSVDATGKSSTIVTKKDDGTAITYSDLIAFDGYVNIHNSPTDLNTILAQGDIGGNALTGSKKTYTLATANPPGVSGTATFSQRVNNNTLVDIAVTGTLPAGTYPALVHAGSVGSPGANLQKTLTLNSVDGTSKSSSTNVRTLDGGIVITYTNWLTYSGFLDVETSAVNPAPLCQGNIGAN